MSAKYNTDVPLFALKYRRAYFQIEHMLNKQVFLSSL